MATSTVTRNAQVTIPKEIRKTLGIGEGDRVTMRVDGGKLVVEKVSEDVWDDCTGFLVEGFDRSLERMRADSTKRLKRMGLIP